MKQELTPMEFRRRLGEVLDRVHLRQDRFIIARKGKPLAALVPVEVLEGLERAARLHLGDVLERLATPGDARTDADALADQAKHASRPA